MRKKNIIASIIMIIIGALVIPFALDLGFKSQTADGVPGAGFFPTIISVIIVVLGLLLLVQTLLVSEPNSRHVRSESKQVEGEDNSRRSNQKNALATVCFLIAYLFLWKFLGFYIATFLTSSLMSRFFRQSLKFSIFFSVVFVGVLYLVFSLGLKIQFVI